MLDTVADFWSCVWEHSVGVVVMLTPLVEGDTVKCARYWPHHPGHTTIFGDWEVRTDIIQGVRKK